ncbi:synaptogenesis protein syg-2 [Caerostris darwini]|uniref:Synaptogenesis protein syg-2 n=1 Tax=Caerostris darwini TaxID=1538125 RepID=A0AAV4QIZ1_9ARAC|nr:synaptogenesis protein syg-2 [Caerostris darwini]
MSHIISQINSVQTEEKEGKSRFIASSYLKIRPLVQDDGAKFACEAFHKALDHRMRNEVTLSVLRKYISVSCISTRKYLVAV